ncbi:MAG: helix-hairpin-helix domain-containing protein [Synergistaceae bacterium]|nr:helix-hairpin-helix domain-containing protein [Synergistaceae bacterium]
MWRELWKKYGAALCLCAGMLCFIVAGLAVRALPGVREKLIVTETVRPQPRQEQTSGQVRPQPQLQSQTQAQGPAEAQPQPVESRGPEIVGPSPEPTPPAPRLRQKSAVKATGLYGTPANENEEENEDGWVLYITGSVRKPGVYRVPRGARLYQLVEMAGGLQSFADSASVNMAAPLEDGLHIHIPRKGQRYYGNSTIVVQPEVRYPASAVPRPGSGGSSSAGVLDINRATAEELTRLKGVGPALARRIVEYRSQNGRFQNINDLLQVRGIGAKKLEKLRKFVTLGP